MTEHVSGEALAAYVDGRLERRERGALEAHFGRCPECRRELADVVAALSGREEAPVGFLDKALAGLAVRPPGRRLLVLRPAFGVAAAFLVAALVGFFFLGRGRLEIPPPVAADKQVPAAERKGGQPAAAGETPAAPHGAQAVTRPQAEAPAAADEEKKAVHDGEFARPVAKAKTEPAAAPAPPALPAEEAEDACAENVGAAAGRLAQAPAREPEPGIGESSLRAAPGEALAPLKSRAAASSFQDRARPQEQAAPVLRKMRAASGALQLLLAASNAAAAPPTLGLVELASGPLVSVAGDAAAADLLPPGLAAVGDWLPPGAALELTVDAGGRVTAVNLLGEWPEDAAARARQGALRLAFLPQDRPRRRAVLRRDPPI